MSDILDLDSLLLGNPDKCQGIPFAVSRLDGSMLDPVEARSLGLRGLLKEYCCSDCKESVVFKWCKDRVDHFSHKAGSECKSSGMTSLHLMAQQILVEEKQCYLPRSAVKRGLSDWIMVCKEVRGFAADKATMEVRCDCEGANRIGDVVFYKGKHNFVIEVAVTHFCDEDKVKNYRDSKIPSLEINLSKLKRDISKKELTAVLTGVGVKYSQLSRLFKWIYHPRYEQSETVAREQDIERLKLQEIAEQKRKIDFDRQQKLAFAEGRRKFKAMQDERDMFKAKLAERDRLKEIKKYSYKTYF